MALLVKEYGGTSDADIDRIAAHMAGKVIKTKEAGNGVVVVLSVMAGSMRP